METGSDFERPEAGDSSKGRTSLVLAASQIEFLERLCARFRRDSGARFTKAMLIRELVAALDRRGAPPAGVRSETHLKEWLRGVPDAAVPRIGGGRP
ncbi:MAG TPA: hypothetical protein VKH46_04845 [Thermoanaerobaculia bacterium]|jgi:hypothetical protein|nr:hypothetical protein [Thermoanaerobaculia bacterium]